MTVETRVHANTKIIANLESIAFKITDKLADLLDFIEVMPPNSEKKRYTSYEVKYYSRSTPVEIFNIDPIVDDLLMTIKIGYENSRGKIIFCKPPDGYPYYNYIRLHRNIFVRVDIVKEFKMAQEIYCVTVYYIISEVGHTEND